MHSIKESSAAFTFSLVESTVCFLCIVLFYQSRNHVWHYQDNSDILIVNEFYCCYFFFGKPPDQTGPLNTNVESLVLSNVSAFRIRINSYTETLTHIRKLVSEVATNFCAVIQTTHRLFKVSSDRNHIHSLIHKHYSLLTRLLSTYSCSKVSMATPC